jgi:hypothetical protein
MGLLHACLDTTRVTSLQFYIKVQIYDNNFKLGNMVVCSVTMKLLVEDLALDRHSPLLLITIPVARCSQSLLIPFKWKQGKTHPLLHHM